ncbi:MAG: amidohydrolase [Flavobacteriales bacterium]|nr:amidohydrolase [Flavobacteriales bacterium]
MNKVFYILASISLLTSCVKSEKADLIVRNGLIYTVDGGFTIGQAMAIKDGKIIEIGKEHEITNKYRYDNLYDAQTRPIYPGFIDAHCHFLGYGLSLQQVNLVGTKSFEEVIERVVEFAKTSPGEWIEGRGWDQNDWSIQEFPTKEKLDELFPNQPVFIKRIDGHAALANSEALKRASITVETQVSGGIIQQIEGKLTGILIDNALDLVKEVIPKPNEAQLTKALLDAQKNCFAVGLTTIDDAGLEKREVELIDRLQQEGKLQMKIYAMLTDNKENLDYYLNTGPYKTDRLNVRSFKFYGDGALGSRGACLLSPYSDVTDSSHYGFLLRDETYYRESAEKLYKAGFQMNTHCIGDSANRLFLNIYGSILPESNDNRWRIEHCQVVDGEDLKIFGKYGIIPSVQPTHATSDMYWADERLGETRIGNAYAYQQLKNQLGFLALGTDFPIESIDPLKTFYAAVVREDMEGFPKGGYQMENALSRKDALRGITIWAAISNFEENEKGSLEVGKSADFIVLQKDILTIPTEELKNNKVVATFINGKQVFPAK